MFFFQQNWSPLFFISHSRSFSVILVNVDVKIKSKERIGFVVVVFFICKSPGGYAIFNDQMQGYLKCKISPHLHEGVDVRTDNIRICTDDFVTTKISWMHR